MIDANNLAADSLRNMFTMDMKLREIKFWYAGTDSRVTNNWLMGTMNNSVCVMYKYGTLYTETGYNTVQSNWRQQKLTK
jgi:hypothetical protein